MCRDRACTPELAKVRQIVRLCSDFTTGRYDRRHAGTQVHDESLGCGPTGLGSANCRYKARWDWRCRLHARRWDGLAGSVRSKRECDYPSRWCIRIGFKSCISCEEWRGRYSSQRRPKYKEASEISRGNHSSSIRSRCANTSAAALDCVCRPRVRTGTRCNNSVSNFSPSE
jgi:hypothetical protein